MRLLLLKMRNHSEYLLYSFHPNRTLSAKKEIKKKSRPLHEDVVIKGERLCMSLFKTTQNTTSFQNHLSMETAGTDAHSHAPRSHRLRWQAPRDPGPDIRPWVGARSGHVTQMGLRAGDGYQYFI